MPQLKAFSMFLIKRGCVCLLFLCSAVYAEQLPPSDVLNERMQQGDVLRIKNDAPHTYVVKKGDTLWDISSIYLDKPWYWPRIWRNNPDITNPHLIYPGDQLSLQWHNGRPVMTLNRNKPRVTLSPQGIKHAKRAEPIAHLNWDFINTMTRQVSVISATAMAQRGSVLGALQPNMRFIEGDYLVAQVSPTLDTYLDNEKNEQNPAKGQFIITRPRHTLYDMQGRKVGQVVANIATVSVAQDNVNNIDNHNKKSQAPLLLHIDTQLSEVKVNDWVVKADVQASSVSDFSIEAGYFSFVEATTQQARLIAGLEPRRLYATNDIVILHHDTQAAEKSEQHVGVVFGLYPQHADWRWQTTQQIGQAVVFASQQHISYALITHATQPITRGVIAGRL